MGKTKLFRILVDNRSNEKGFCDVDWIEAQKWVV
jgi:hypothetical protein